MKDRNMTLEEVAAILRVSYRTVRRYVAGGSLRPLDIGRGANPVYRVTPDELNRFCAERQQRPRASIR